MNLFVLLTTVATASPVQAQPLCADAAAFLRTDRQMSVVVEADTLDDWRTRRKLTGCRITAAGGQ